jgi:chemotaxis protein MotB
MPAKKTMPEPQAAFSESMKRIKNRLQDQVEINEEQSKTTIRLGEAILFQSGHADLSNNAIRTLEELANSINLVEGQVVIEGHTDNVPVTSAVFKSNWELSAARAFSVIHALGEHGVNTARLAAWGFGETRPVAPNDTELHRAQNRRIEIVILKAKQKTA